MLKLLNNLSKTLQSEILTTFLVFHSASLKNFKIESTMATNVCFFIKHYFNVLFRNKKALNISNALRRGVILSCLKE